MSEPKMSAKLSLFTAFAESFSSDGASRSPARSPRRRSFDDDGLVGLGIVAALNEPTPPERVVVSAVSPRTRPIPIRPSGGGGEGRRGRVVAEEMLSEAEMMSESYTCVISHVGGKDVRRSVYFDWDFGGGSGDLLEDLGVVFEQPPPQEAADVEEMAVGVGFLSHCFLCKKNLHGLDIFMYRGEKAFCSVECRSHQIQSDEYREKCGSEAMKTFDCSVSPCSAPLHFSAGIAAA